MAKRAKPTASLDPMLDVVERFLVCHLATLIDIDKRPSAKRDPGDFGKVL